MGGHDVDEGSDDNDNDNRIIDHGDEPSLEEIGTSLPVFTTLLYTPSSTSQGL